MDGRNGGFVEGWREREREREKERERDALMERQSNGQRRSNV
jgi:hypothetical protein